MFFALSSRCGVDQPTFYQLDKRSFQVGMLFFFGRQADRSRSNFRESAGPCVVMVFRDPKYAPGIATRSKTLQYAYSIGEC